MLSTNLKDSFVINCFREFYREIVISKAIALSGQMFDIRPHISQERLMPDLQEITSEDTQALRKSSTLAKKIFGSLELLLGNQLNKITQSGGEFSLNYYREALYIMVALADEIFLNLKWSGRQEWENNLLESRFFGTHTAGTTFFEKLDTYLATRDPSSRDIGALYLWALGLGFQGKYRGEDFQSEIGPYKRKLYYFIMWRSPELFQGKSPLFRQSYGNIIEDNIVKTLPNPRLYFIIFVGILMSLFLTSGILWYIAARGIYNPINAIISQAKGKEV